MNKISKSLTFGAVGLLVSAFAFTTVPFAAALNGDQEDQTAGDLNGLSGAVAESAKVQITTKSVLTIDSGNPGQASSIDADGTVTKNLTPATGESYNDNPNDIRDVIPGTQKNGYNYHIVKTNNEKGYSLYLMMCTDTADADDGSGAEWLAVPQCSPTQNLVRRIVSADATNGNIDTTNNSVYIAPTSGSVADLSLNTVTSATGGFWGFRNNSITSQDTTALTSDPFVTGGNYKAVPAFVAGAGDVTASGTDMDTTFDDDPYTGTAYGAQLMTSAKAGAGVANTVFSVLANNQLPAGTYANYVIYTAVANL